MRFLNWVLKIKDRQHYVTTFPGPDTIYYHKHRDGSTVYFDTLEDLCRYVKQREEK